METKKGILDIVKYRYVWIALSALFLIPGIIAMCYSTAVNKTPLLLGIDYTGGTMLQYGFEKEITKTEEGKIRSILEKMNIDNAVIQTSAPIIAKENAETMDTAKEETATTAENKTEATAEQAPVQETTQNKNQYVVSIRTRYLETTADKSEAADILTALKAEFGNVQVLQVNAIGPTLGNELYKNSVTVLILAFFGIVVYLWIRFQWDYAVFALLALFHDAVFILGFFSILGLVYHTQIDVLFITAILTVIGFSVHDTIVVYDRIRENNRFLAKKMSFGEIANISVNQTLMRSIATSVTTLLTLLALYFLGGETTKDFVLVMILGITIGTYSSIFFASTLLVMYREHAEKQKALARALK